MNLSTAEITVTDYSTGGAGTVWTQVIPPGGAYTATALVISPTFMKGTVTGPGLNPKTYPYEITLRPETAIDKAFHLKVTPPDSTPSDGYPYTKLPLYPFVFKQSDATTGPWYYVQNNGGEGTLLPVGDAKIRGFGGWAGGQPWWGITNLQQAMMARLDSFARIQNPSGAGDESAYEIPMEIEYSFRGTGGYVGLAKAYRDYYLRDIDSSLDKLATRATDNTDLFFLKYGTYAYFWADPQATFETLVTTMKGQGIDSVIAMFNLNEDPERLKTPTLENIQAGTSKWIGGKYSTPTPNLFKICDISDWVGKLLLHKNNTTETTVVDADNDNWDQLYTPTAKMYWETGASTPNSGIPYVLNKYGDMRVFYHDTLPQQLGPCVYRVPPNSGTPYVETIQENRTGRQAILDVTHQPFLPLHPYGFVSGSGEGISAWWTVSHLDYWEGGMEESIYADISRSPISEYWAEFADDYFPCDPPPAQCGTDQESWKDQEAESMLENERIPLLALQWHDYVAQTWNWRNSNFVVQSLSWKKDLFNILYCAMPMWHVTDSLWTGHMAEYVASYEKLRAVRQANGFAEMTSHGWLDDVSTRKVQYTDWDSGDRVIVNFDSSNAASGDFPYTDTDGVGINYGSANVPAGGYVMLPYLIAENCETSGTPAGWSNSGNVAWDYATTLLEGAEAVRMIKTGGGRTRFDFADQAEATIYFKLRLSGTTSARIIGGLGANGGTIKQLFQLNSSFQPSFGSATSSATTSAVMLLDTTYDVWLHYRKGTGANGVVDIGFSTDGTRPTSGSNFARLSNCPDTTNAGRLFLGPAAQSTFDSIFDKIRVSPAQIGNRP